MNLPGVVVVGVAANRFSVVLPMLAATYESYALATGRVPTISGQVKALARHKQFRWVVMFGMGFVAHHLLVGDGS